MTGAEIVALITALGIGGLLSKSLDWFIKGITGSASRRRNEVDKIAAERDAAIKAGVEAVNAEKQKAAEARTAHTKEISEIKNGHLADMQELREEVMHYKRRWRLADIRADSESAKKRVIAEHASTLRGILNERRTATPDWPEYENTLSPAEIEDLIKREEESEQG